MYLEEEMAPERVYNALSNRTLPMNWVVLFRMTWKDLFQCLYIVWKIRSTAVDCSGDFGLGIPK